MLHFDVHVQYVSVAVPVPFLERLTYRVPDHLEPPVVGARVRVPVGSRTVTGCVVQQSAEAPDADAIKDLVEIVDGEPFLPPGVVKLCEWVAEYYLAGIGDAIAVAMPPGARARATSFKTRQVATVTAHGLAWADPAQGQAPGQAPNLAPGLAPNLTPGLAPNLAPGLTPNLTPNLAPGLVPGLTPNLTPSWLRRVKHRKVLSRIQVVRLPLL
jgi:primosomal protein N'